MGRPRLIRTKDGGEISLKNVSAELVEKVRAAMEDPIVNIAPPTTDTTFDDPEVRELPYVAVGTYQSTDGWHVVEVKYNPTSKTSEVHSDKMVGDRKAHAIERFKILASNHKIV